MLPTNCIKNNQTEADTLEPSETNNNEFGFNIQTELENLEHLILNGTNVPLTELTILDRDLLLEQLDRVKENLSTDLDKAIEIADRKQQIIADAEGYAYLIVKSAEEKASEILHESSIVRQAELDGAKVRLETERQCEELKQKTWNDLEQLRRNTIAECEAIQMGADNYADDVLGDLEYRLQGMLCVIQNGRQQLDSTEPE